MPQPLTLDQVFISLAYSLRCLSHSISLFSTIMATGRIIRRAGAGRRAFFPGSARDHL
jgi:hypothetical protein